MAVNTDQVGRGEITAGTVYTIRSCGRSVGDARCDGQRSLEERILCGRQRDRDAVLKQPALFK
jgi:hypothetical protein